jgi:hypothetical protein
MPAGDWDYFLSYVVNQQNPSSGAEALVVSGMAHGGSNSVHIVGGQQPAMITRPLPDGTNRMYLRAWFYMSEKLGNYPQSSNANHETLIGIRGEPGGANREVRFGEIKGTLGTNEVPSDNIAPTMDQWNSGAEIPGGQWVCIEVAFLGDAAYNELHAWADGELVHSVTAADQWQNGAMPANWMNGMFTEAILGWHSFSSRENEIWIDDIVASTERVGCD